MQRTPPERHAPIAIAARILGTLALATAGGGCAERVRAEPAPPPCIAATGIEMTADDGAGGTFRVEAEAAVLSPRFPDEIAGTFDAPRAVLSKDGPAPADGSEFTVRARRMRYDSRTDRASFSGSVEFVMDDLRLACDAAEVTYRREQGTADFVATGAVRLERSDLTATAGKAEYRGETRVLALTESPRVEGRVGTVEGTRIVLSLEDNTVTVEEVRGRFRLDRPPASP